MTGGWLPWIAIALLLILAVALIVLIIRGGGFKSLWRKQVAAQEIAAAKQGASELGPPATLRAAIGIAGRELRSLVAGGRGPVDVPWTLALGAGGGELLALLPPPMEAQHEISWIDEEHLESAGTVTFRTGGVVVGFEDGLIGAPRAGRRLADLLRQIERVRPDRPIDSIAIVIPWSFLERALDEDAGDVAATLGRELYHVVLGAQQRTGWRVPIYILLSECDKIPGFSAHAEAVLQRSNEPVIGWPAPKPLDSMFETSWLDEAFASLNEILSAQQFHLLMGMEDPERSEEVLLFPARLAAIRPMLEILLKAMLQSSAYHEGFMLRGIFLIGETETPEEAPAIEATVVKDVPAADVPAAAMSAAWLPAPVAAPKTAVATESPTRRAQRLAQALFLTKIFPEWRLAQPAYGEMTRRHRLVRRSQIALVAATLLFALGLVSIRYRTPVRVAPVEQLLDDIIVIKAQAVQRRRLTQDLATGRCFDAPLTNAADPLFGDEFGGKRQSAIELLHRMARVDTNHLATAFAPTTFLAFTDERVEEAISKSMHQVVFEAIAESLTTRSGIMRLIGRGAESPLTDSYWPMTVRNVVAYDKTYRLVELLEDGSPRHPALVANFAEVVRYSLAENLPAGFSRQDDLYVGSIANYQMPCIDSAAVRGKLLWIVAGRYAATVDNLYVRNGLVPIVGSIAMRFGGGSEAVDTSVASLRALIDEIDSMGAQLAIPGRYSWIYADRPEDVAMPSIAALQSLKVIDAEAVAGLPVDHRRRVLETASKLRDARLYGARMLAPAGAAGEAPAAAAAPVAAPASPAAGALPAPTLSRAMVDSRAYLQSLFAQPFMNPRPAALAYNVGWDYARVRAAGDIVRAYSAFVAADGGATPEPLRAVARDAARRHVAAQLESEIAQATPATPPRSPIAESDAAAFIQALPMLQATRNLLAEAGAGGAAAQLNARVAERAVRLLAMADAQLGGGDNGPYAVDRYSLAAWNGSGSLAAATFGVDTPEDLAATLPQRRAAVAAIARGRVAPLLAYLADPGTGAVGAPLVAKWQAITDTLQADEAGNPNNSLNRLERFISVDIDKLREDCGRIRGVRGASGDYFAAQQAAIAARVAGHCAEAAGSNAFAQYEKLREAFYVSLAGRFPFGSDRAASADPGAVQSFFETYGSTLAPLRARLEAERPGSEAAAVLGQLQRVQTALAPMLTGPGPLSYAVDVAFFTDPTLAKGQHQIVEGRLGTTPADEAKTPHGPRGFTWTMGQPVRLSLRWALNAPSLPIESIADPAGECRPPAGGGVASVRVDDTWALLRLIARYQSRDGGDLDGSDSGIPLAFTIPVCANLQRAPGGDDRPGPARVFLRLSLSAKVQAPDKPDRQVPVALPDFPRSVPRLDGSDSLP
jgi:type VI secretion system protein ImpL